jgi:hypothetical protein
VIEVQKLHNEIGFRVSSELLKQLHDWEYSVDEMVFKEQLATGSYKGRYSVEGFILEMMQQAEQQGKIMPYYGAGGSSGACAYKFRLKGSKCNLRVEHSLTGDALDLEADIKEANALLEMIREPEIQFSILPYVTDEELDKPWTGERNPTLVCKIAGQEYETLTQWKNWMNEQALTPRYIYQFAQVSLGATGFTVKVEDTETGEVIDATDYDDW